MAEGARDEGAALVVPDAAERLCLVCRSSDGEETIRFARFDCGTGQARELTGTREEIAITLDDLGARRWLELDDDSTSHKVVRDPAPGWLDLPNCTEGADKLSEGAVNHINEVLGRWEPFFPAAPGVRALRATLDAREGRSAKPLP